MLEVGNARVFLGDCREVLKALPDNSVDSVVTDPPYELGFMGKSWDSSGIAYDVTVWAECLRVLKPGGHILAFGGSRTWHRLAVAIEDAGFEIRDSIAWMYGSGFPKSLDVSKAIDKRLGAEREVVGTRQGKGSQTGVTVGAIGGGASEGFGHGNTINETSAHTPEAKQWEGWGTALKPAFEPVVVGRKPFGKGSTVAANVLLHGVGGLNIDGSRIGTDKPVMSRPKKPDTPKIKSDRTPTVYASEWNEYQEGTGRSYAPEGQGRWPANVILDEYSAGLLDEQSGTSKSPPVGSVTNTKPHHSGSMVGGFANEAPRGNGYGDTGGASRFFYCAKASKRDRNEGLEGLEDRVGENGNKWTDQDYRRGDDAPTTTRKNFHPTVKPTALMRYLIKLVTPVGGTVLDPFTGSGSTGKAALLDGYKFIGAELTEEYLPIIEGRLKWALQQQSENGGKLF
jgi:site-specific DNA-methyltransferase (adenine-specific)